jgi:hypothetical protein
MTTPIGSGKNARYGYEEEELFCGEESKTCSAERPPDEELICRAEVDGLDAPQASSTSDEEKTAPCDISPDYVTVSGSASLVLHAMASGTVDRYGRVYTAGGGGASTPGIGASIMGGYLRDPDHLCEPPAKEVLEAFLTGGSRSFGGGAGIGIGATTSSGMWAVEVGATTPQLGWSYAVGGRHPDAEKRHDK